MGEGGAQAEIHAQCDVGCTPVGGAVRGHRVERSDEVAGRIRRAAPDMRLVEMGVRVDEGRQRDPAGKVHALGVVGLQGPGWRDLCEETAVDQEIGPGEAVAVRALDSEGQVRRQHARVEERETIRRGKGRNHKSRPLALSCQRRSRRCERAAVKRKIATPVIEMRTRAANMRGMLSR